MFKFLIIFVFSFNLYAKAGCNKYGQDFELRLESVVKTLKISKSKLNEIIVVLNQEKKEARKNENDLKNIKQKILDELSKESVDEGALRFLKEELTNKIFTSVDNKTTLLSKIRVILGPENFIKLQNNHRLRLQKDKKRNNLCE